MSGRDEWDDWSGLLEDEPPEFWPAGCLVALGACLIFWVVVIAGVTWLLIR